MSVRVSKRFAMQVCVFECSLSSLCKTHSYNSEHRSPELRRHSTAMPTELMRSVRASILDAPHEAIAPHEANTFPHEPS